MLYIQGNVTAVLERANDAGRVRRTVDMEGLELSVPDDVKLPAEGSLVRARVYVHTIRSQKGSFVVNEIRSWEPALPA